MHTKDCMHVMVRPSPFNLDLRVLCGYLSRARVIVANNFERHRVQCRKAKKNGDLEWWSDNLHDEQWQVVLMVDQFLFTHGGVVLIVLYVFYF